MPNTLMSPFSDWLALPLEGLLWSLDSTFGTPVEAGLTYTADELDADNEADYAGNATYKPTVTRSTVYDFDAGIYAKIRIPDYVVNKQPDRFTEWDGTLGTDYATVKGGRRVALLLELVLSSRASDVVGSDLTSLAFGVKFRGYGAPLSGDGDAPTEDTPICGATLLANSVFYDMTLPSETGGDSNLAPTFAPDGVARFWCCVEVPNTVGHGDVAEISIAFVVPNEEGPPPAVQVQHLAYCWIRDPFPFYPNRAIQLLGQTYEDDGADGNNQLEAQSRADELPYEP